MLHFASQRDADAHVLDEQIDELQSKNRLNANQKTRLVTLQQQRHALKSPVHALSDDVLGYIFEIGWGDGQDSSFAWNVSHVASRWRRVALATPRLWNRVVIHLPSVRTRSNGRWTAVVERSRSCTLNVTVRINTIRQSDRQSSSLDLMEQLVSRAHTCFITQTSLWPYPFALPTFTDALKTLTLRNLSLWDMPDWMKQITMCLSSCLALRNLSVSYIRGIRQMKYLAPDPEYRVDLPLLESLRLEESPACFICAHLRAKPLTMVLRLSRLDMEEPWYSVLLPHALDKLSDVQSIEFSCLASRQSATRTILKLLGAAPKLDTLTLRDARLSFLPGEDRVPNPPPVKRLVIFTDWFPAGEGIKNIIQALEPELTKSSLIVELQGAYAKPPADLLKWLKEHVQGVTFSSLSPVNAC